MVKKINIITLGCSKNTVDSEVLMGKLLSSKFSVTHEAEGNKFHTVIINTCGFIKDSKQESIDAIIEFAEAKRKGIIKKLYVTGCLSERYRDALRDEIPEVDGIFGVHELDEILKELSAEKTDIIDRELTTPSHYAYFKIAEGCDRKCSFCSIPLIRGKHVSKSIEDLLSEADYLAKKKVKELILISQDLSYYGIDLNKKRQITELVRKLSDTGKFDWIRLHYLFPTGFPLDLLDLMNERENICKYIDIPLQHISDRILSSMNRGTSKAETIKLIETIRKKVPGVAIRTAFIVGYPGETKKEFEELKLFVKELEFERLGLFTYSHEEGTPAHTLKDSVSEIAKRSRYDELMELQSEISLKNNKKHIGQSLKVLIDRKEDDYFIGRTEFDSPEIDNEVVISSKDLRIGNFYNVNITDADYYDLFAEHKPA
jgi:ribosomal protein S12 methylthiotransferase